MFIKQICFVYLIFFSVCVCDFFCLIRIVNAICLSSECAQEFGDDILKFSVRCIGDLTIGRDLLEECLFGGLDVLQKFFFEFGDLSRIHFVQITTYTAVDDGNLFSSQK